MIIDQKIRIKAAKALNPAIVAALMGAAIFLFSLFVSAPAMRYLVAAILLLLLSGFVGQEVKKSL